MKRMAAPLTAALLVFSASLTPHDRVSTRLSWDGDVQRIVDARCVSCHTSGLVNLSTFATARPWARAIREAILEGHGYSPAGGAALTPFERELLVQWIDGGAPERTPARLAATALPETYVRLASPHPLRTLDDHQARLGGTRAIIPGLGLALRAPGRIIVIDRGAGPDARVIGRGRLVPSLAAHLAALPASTNRTRISDAAYIVGPVDAPRQEVAEIAPEGPDRFWCPMHPDARSPASGACPRCGMALVEMPAPSLDAFNLEIVKTEAISDGTRVTMRVTRGADGRPVTSFVTLHERPFHLFVVDDTLELFDHVHPELSGDTLVVTIDERPDKHYWLVGDFMPVDGFPQLRMVRLPKHPKARGGIGDRLAPTVQARLEPVDIRAGREARLTFDVTDATTGAVPDDLEPYLGAAAHLFAIDETLRDPTHAHPIELAEGGIARPAFDVRFPRAGRYVMWLQLQRAGRVETLRFTAEVSK
ncbi:MAG TPA: heavy metal-binding domain-containing protein [Vicinamibacterales bacterium]|nr:heavy metal-binding domain-containing protein [Vicinamibacterales bacterium]